MTITTEAVTPTERKEVPKGAVASLVCGIIGVTIPVIGFIPGIIAIVLGNKSRKKPNGGMGTAGFVLGIITTVFYSFVFSAGIYIEAIAPRATGYTEGVAAYERGDYKTALREIKPLAERGNAKAQLILGIMYGEGEGVPKNHREAARWYRKAAEQGNADAQASLGALYTLGQGVPLNYREATKWYRKAAVQGNPAAQHNLGIMYKEGLGVPRNYTLAYMWIRLAENRGKKTAAKDLEIIEKLMTPADLSKAQAMVAKWKPKKVKQT